MSWLISSIGAGRLQSWNDFWFNMTKSRFWANIVQNFWDGNSSTRRVVCCSTMFVERLREEPPIISAIINLVCVLIVDRNSRQSKLTSIPCFLRLGPVRIYLCSYVALLFKVIRAIKHQYLKASRLFLIPKPCSVLKQGAHYFVHTTGHFPYYVIFSLTCWGLSLLAATFLVQLDWKLVYWVSSMYAWWTDDDLNISTQKVTLAKQTVSGVQASWVGVAPVNNTCRKK